MKQLLNGDCLELMKDIADGSVDMILCDLPYGTTACKWDTVIPFEPLWEQYNRIIKANGAIVLFGSEPFSTELRHSNLKMFKYDWIWDKKLPTNVLHCKRMPLRRYEVISVFYKKQPTYNPQMRTGIPRKKGKVSRSEATAKVNHREGLQQYVSDQYYPTNIIEFSTAQFIKSKVHPAQKPVPLLEYLVKTYTNPGDTVLDNCMGSGSTGVACANTSRNFIGIELDKQYFDIAVKRIENAEMAVTA